MNNLQLNYRFDFARRLFYFLIVTLVCLLLAGVVMSVIMSRDADQARLLRVATVVQDVLVFILPALITAIIVTQLPASMLGVDRMFSMPQLLLAVAVMIASTPAMNMLIDWNANLTLPSWAAGFEDYMRQAEESAARSIKVMLSGDGVGTTIVAVMIVGVMAGLSEELFFRGTLQRLLASGRMGPHAAIWLTAVIFSLFHFQFFGFFPRVALGAFFGYLLWWSGSIWLPVIIHALNNSVYVITERDPRVDVGSFGLNDIWLVAASVIVTVILIRSLAITGRGSVK